MIMKKPLIPKKEFDRLGLKYQEETYKFIKQSINNLNSLQGYSREWTKKPKKELEEILEELLMLKLES